MADNNFWKNNPLILVTGGSGLCGSALKSAVSKKQLNKYFVFVSSKHADLTKPKDCENLFKKYRPSHVVHLAAAVGGLFKNMKNPVEFWNNNVSINNNVLNFSHKFNVKKVISCLSTCIFPDKSKYPIDESMIHDGPPHDSNECYAYSKRMLDVLNRAYNKQYGRMFTSIIPTNIYGPNDNFNLEEAHVVPSLIHKCYLAKKNKTLFTAFGTGKPLRQFLYSEDLSLLLLKIIEQYECVDPIILSVDEKDEVPISKVVELIAEYFSMHDKINWDNTKSDGQFKKTANNRKLRELFPDFKFTPLEEGLKKTCEWFERHYPNLRI